MTQTTQTAEEGSGGGPRRARMTGIDVRQYIVYIALVLVFVMFAVALGDQGFLESNNLLNIVRQTATISIMAVAMVFVLSSAEIDLSIGAIAGLASVVTALAIEAQGILLGVVAGLTVGIVIGAINGFLVTIARIPSFLVTLGMLGIVTGFAQLITNTAPVPILSDSYNSIFGGGDIGPVPGLVIWTLAAVAAGHVFLRHTPFGRKVLATGGNRMAAEYSGIRTNQIKFKVLMISALAASVAGMIYAGRLQTGRYQWGQGDELSVIAAAILGGTSLFGGKGTVIGALAGSLLIGLINNGLVLGGFDYSQQQMARGAIIIFAVALARR